MFSSTDDLPADWLPTTTICGRLIWIWSPMTLKTSCSLLMTGIS